MVPDSWRTAHIVPGFKKGASGDISNYRPISLTSVPSKIMERIVTKRDAEDSTSVPRLHSSAQLYVTVVGSARETRIMCWDKRDHRC